MTLSYKQQQRLTVFMHLRECSGNGATRAELAIVLDMANGPTLRGLLDEMVSLSMLTKRRAIEDPRAPWKYYAPDIAWRVKDGTR